METRQRSRKQVGEGKQVREWKQVKDEALCLLNVEKKVFAIPILTAASL